MKRRLMICLMLLAAIAVRAQSGEAAASEKNSFAQHFYAVWRCGAGLKNHGMETRNFNVQAGYEVLPRLNPFIQAEGLLGLYHRGDTKTYFNTTNIGAGLSYGIIPDIDVYGMWGTSVKSNGWKYNAYEAGLMLKSHGKGSVAVGIAYKFVDSRSAGVDDYKGIVFTAGFRW